MLKKVRKAHHNRSLLEIIHAHFTVFSIVTLGLIVIIAAVPVVKSIFPAKAAPTTLNALSVTTLAAEDSGLVASRQYPGVFWYIRDGGPATAEKPRDAVYSIKFDANGNPIAVRGTDKFPFNLVTGSTNNNWEDIAMDTSNNIWIGDIGANECSRNNQAFLKIAEPNPTTTATMAITAKYTFKFPDPASGCNTWNSEAMFWLDGSMYIFSKTSNSPVYKVTMNTAGNPMNSTATLTRIGQLTGGVSNISGSSMSDDRTRLMVESQQQMNVYTTTNTSLTGDAWVKDIISRAPKYTSNFNCGCGGNSSVEGGSFKRNSYDLAFVSESKHIFYAKPAAYGDSGTQPPAGDTIKPTVSIIAPTANATVSASIVIGVNASDNVAVTRVDVFYDGTRLIRNGTSQGTNGWGSGFDTRTIADGSHTFNVTAYDAAGNTNSSQVSVVVKNTTAPPPAPTITSFVPTPSSVTVGNRITFNWATTNSVSCSVTPNGSTNTTSTTWQTTNLTTPGTFTYKLTCKNSANVTVEKSANITVTPAPTPPTNVVLSTTTNSVTKGSNAFLTWTSSGSTGCTLNPGSFFASGTGSSKSVPNLQATTTFKVTCTNNAGTKDSNSVVVTVTQPNTPPLPPPNPTISNFSASSTNVTAGTIITLSWTANNVVTNGCVLAPSPLSTAGATGQWSSGPLSASISYTLTCRNSVGATDSKHVSIIVNQKPAPKPPDPVTPAEPKPTPEDTTPETITDIESGDDIWLAQYDDEVAQGDLVTLDSSNNTDEDKMSLIEKVEYYNGDELIATVTEAPYALDSSVLGEGTYNIMQRTYFTDGSTAEQSQLLTIGAPEDVPGSQPVGKKNTLGLAIAFLIVVMAATFGLLRLFMWRSNRLIAAHDSDTQPNTPADQKASQIAAFLDKREALPPGAVIEPKKKDPPA